VIKRENQLCQRELFRDLSLPELIHMVQERGYSVNLDQVTSKHEKEEMMKYLRDHVKFSHSIGNRDFPMFIVAYVLGAHK
jgi:hypothetical protein